MKRVTDASDELIVQAVVDGIMEKKGCDILSINLRKHNNAICSYFVVCHGDSDTQVRAISKSIEDSVEQKLNLRVTHVEGSDNAEWVLLDFLSVVVHVFQKPTRDYYKLEELWADATTKTYKDEAKK